MWRGLNKEKKHQQNIQPVRRACRAGVIDGKRRCRSVLERLKRNMIYFSLFVSRVSGRRTYSINVVGVSEVEVVDVRFELFENLVVTSHVRRQDQLSQLLLQNAVQKQLEVI